MAKRKTGDESIESKLTAIEQMIEQLESGELSLDESLKLFTDGTLLIQDCRTLLDQTAQKIEAITQKDADKTPISDDIFNDFANHDDIPF
ncbi:exodeoxyribonuclease VII small subunit [Wohlfahrtiimonas chitiniclastica]|uniref:exodeoxyribonuclease VII small subunit n=1 Tax=Wohlfahrtiimonas chitiniclastica TaxID=400946 RepID=UPI000B996AEE|nr:exodeoxyribonuclease VII small subunit [Wohlfahrtiimonas chitiniclastica]OYQ78410.1 exodeoxyribonuclease VII small subunit [Wohlfahrtiimonas chitiniclastica]